MRPVKDVFSIPDIRYTKGDIGIEIEVEGEQLPVASNLWRVDQDGSLKSQENAEYVLRVPLSRELAALALDELYGRLNQEGTVMYESLKAGVHIHINVQEYTLIELFNFIVAYLLFEEILVEFCGEFRVGNLFCLRVSDAPYVIPYLVSSLKSCHFSKLDNEIIRYSSLNLMSLHKYGSLEFRAMRSTPDKGAILDWIDLLLCVRDYAKTFNTPVQIIEQYSELDIGQYMRTAFGLSTWLFNRVGNIQEKLKTGMRNAQEIAYCVDWGEAFNVIEDNIFFGVHQKLGGHQHPALILGEVEEDGEAPEEELPVGLRGLIPADRNKPLGE